MPRSPGTYGVNDLCFGYVKDRTGISGVCSCGLHWEGHMPPHNPEGKIIPPYVLEREQKRAAQRAEQQYQRDQTRAELARIGPPMPIGKFWSRRKRPSA